MTKWLSGIGQGLRNLLRFRGLIILAIFLAPVVLGLLAVRQHAGKEPPLKDAPWALQTYIYTPGWRQLSRTYYARQYATVDGTPTLSGYWEWNGKKYVYHEGTKSFPQIIWGKVDIIRRAGQ